MSQRGEGVGEGRREGVLWTFAVVDKEGLEARGTCDPREGGEVGWVGSGWVGFCVMGEGGR